MSAISLSLGEKVEIHSALLMREKAMRDSLARMASDKNPKAYEALKTSYYQSLRIIDGLKLKVSP